MEKVIKISEDTTLKVSNNVSWLFAYRSQFGKDIFPVLVPAINAGIEIFKEIMEQVGDDGLTVEAIKRIPTEDLQDAVLELSGLEMVDLVQIVWAMAKAADDTIAPPEVWLKQFEVFPLDVILPEVVGLAAKGLISSKNLTSLRLTTEAGTK